MQNNKQIIIGEGVGSLKFGMTREELQKNLSEPDYKEIEPHMDVDLVTETWDYEDHGVSFTFDEEEDFRLETITIYSDEFTFQGKGLIGQSKKFIKDMINEYSIGEAEEEDISVEESMPDHILIDVEDANISFLFEGDKLIELQLGVRWDDDGEPLWPSLN